MPSGLPKKRSSVWRYFKDRGVFQSMCIFCSKILSIKGGNTRNLFRHLKRFHPSEITKSVANLPGASSKIYPATVAEESVEIAVCDPLFIKFENEDIVPARQSPLLGSSNKMLRNSKEDEALDISEAKPIVTKVSQPRFTLSWESYQNRLCNNLNTLLMNEDFVDLTLAADGHLVKVHQLIMSIASPYLKEIISSSPARHPIIFLTNVSYTTLKNLLQYVYTGQVDITEKELEPFFAAAKALQIQGMDTEIDTDILKSQGDNHIGVAARLPPDPNKTVAEKDSVEDDDLEESQILIVPRSATTRTSNSPETQRVPSKQHYTHCTTQTKKKVLHQVEELETEDLGNVNVMMDEDMVIVASKDLSGGEEPIEFNPVSQTDDPGPAQNPPPKNTDRVTTVQTMLLNRYKYALTKTFVGGVRKWKCIDHMKYGCQARTVTTGYTVVERSQSHNHPYHDKK